MNDDMQMINIIIPKAHAITLLEVLKTKFTITGFMGAKMLVDMCESIQESIDLSEMTLVHEEER